MRCRSATVVVSLLTTLATFAAEPPQGRPTTTPGAGWFTRLSAGYIYQFETSLEDNAGDFDVNRFLTRASIGYMPDYTKSIAFSVGYDRAAYGFSGSTGFTDPWDDVHTFRIGTPVRWGFNDKWTLFAIPAVRWNVEDGGQWSEAVSGGGFVGVSYRFNEKLTLGPGFGALTQIEDNPSYFPVIIVDWNITGKWQLETGRGLGASQGPGLLLSYNINDAWRLSVGGRYEKFRFRLSETGPVPNGVGEDKGAPVYLGARYRWGRKGSVTLFGGADLGGQLQVDNSRGREISSTDYDPAPFLGLSLDLRF